MRTLIVIAAAALTLGGASLPAIADDGHAVVSANGTLVRGDDVKRVQRTAAGRYVVTFDSSVRSCAYVASVGQPGTGSLTPGVAMVGGTSNARQVRVDVRTLAGAYADRPFHLVITCDDDDDYNDND
jgi:hypothetical protein